MNLKDKTNNNIDIDFLQWLSDWMHNADIHEVTLKDERYSIHIVRRNHITSKDSTVTAKECIEEKSLDHSGHIERSPMVGVAYMAPSPHEDHFISIGQQIKLGETLLIIEAMKVMNYIQATKAGIIEEIFVTDGETIEFDQPLVRII